MSDIYFSKRKKMYYLVNKHKCSNQKCQSDIQQIAFIKVTNKKQQWLKPEIFCMMCMREWKKNNKLQPTITRFQAVHTEHRALPKDSHKIIDFRVTYTRARSVYDIDDMESYTTTDNTKHAGRTPSMEGATIGDPKIMEKIEEKDSRLLESESDVDDFFADIQSSTIITTENRKQLENKDTT